METGDQRFHPAKDKCSKSVLLRNAYSSKHKSSRAKLWAIGPISQLTDSQHNTDHRNKENKSEYKLIIIKP
jgi:hypothetical protein